MANLNIAKILLKTEIEGPGIRMALWLQGCTINCNGCSNQEMIPIEKKMFVPVSKVFELVKYAKDNFNIEGITLLGGEPFIQPDGIRELISYCKTIGLSVLVFTGYIYEKLNEEYSDIFKNIDILIDGPFIMSQMDVHRRLIGSKNQRVLKLTDFYKDNDYFEHPHSEVEIQIYNNRMHINGDGVVFDNEKGEFNLSLVN